LAQGADKMFGGSVNMAMSINAEYQIVSEVLDVLDAANGFGPHCVKKQSYII
jgi:hypothetical protein